MWKVDSTGNLGIQYLSLLVVRDNGAFLGFVLRIAGRGRGSPGVAPARVVEEVCIGKGAEEFDEVGAFLRREGKGAQDGAPVGGVGGATAAGVVIEHAFEGRDAAVMHIGRREGDVAQTGGLELTVVLREVGVRLDPCVGAGVESVESGVVEFGWSVRGVGMAQGSAEVPAPVALEAAGFLAGEEEFLAAFCGF